jgi:hypothetical protein
MEPALAWLDFNAAERERTQRVLAMFEERETRDELGLGAIRDSFSDHLFPGTSTIQTRLRYLFFIPWIYLRLEKQRVPSRDIAAKARKLEVALTEPLLAEIDNAGVFGRLAKGELKRLPSSVYWAGLRLYGICQYPGGREDYHRDLDAIYRRRDRARQEADGGREPYQFTWHPKLPPPPPDFPEHPTFQLTREEALFFRDCLMGPACRNSLLTHLAWHCEPADVEFPWEHPRLATFSEQHRRLLENARLFARTMHGAAILYNLLLAEAGSRDELAAQYADEFQKWSKDLAAEKWRIREWDMHGLWEIARHPSHSITPWAGEFVESGVRLWLDHGAALWEREDARRLVRNREMRLKGPRSRFLNRRALEQWGGEAGLRPMSFRWYNAKTFLKDLAEGLKA